MRTTTAPAIPAADRELADALLKAAPPRGGRSRLSCARVMALARRHRRSPAKAGRLCDDLGIKITSCRLGCFT